MQIYLKVTDGDEWLKIHCNSSTNKYYDIRSFKNASFSKVMECGSAGCIKYLGTSCEPVDCSISSGDDYKYCEPTPSGYYNDYWAGSKKVCDKISMRLLYKSKNMSHLSICQ